MSEPCHHIPTDASPAQAPFQIEANIGYQLRRIVGLLGGEITQRMEPLGLTDAQWKPLLRLHIRQEGTVAALARGCHLDAGGMTRLLDRLEAKGLCERIRSVQDRRVVHIELTPQGRAIAAQIPATLVGLQQIALQGFSDAEHEQLQAFLRRIFDNLQPLSDGADSASCPSSENPAP